MLVTIINNNKKIESLNFNGFDNILTLTIHKIKDTKSIPNLNNSLIFIITDQEDKTLIENSDIVINKNKLIKSNDSIKTLEVLNSLIPL